MTNTLLKFDAAETVNTGNEMEGGAGHYDGEVLDAHVVILNLSLIHI